MKFAKSQGSAPMRAAGSLVRFLAAAILTGGLLIAVPVLTQQPFDDSKFLPQDCKSGKLNCFGLEVESQTEQNAIPKDPANFVKHRGLPSRVDLSANFPPVGNQGSQGSCVAWSTGYAVKSYHEKVERNWSFDAPGDRDRCTSGASRVFSPAFIYNQINNGRDKGSSISNAFRLMTQSGAAPCSSMPYNMRDYLTQPSAEAKAEAAKYRAKSFNQVDCATNIDAMKALLAQGHPMTGGFKVDQVMSKGPIWDRHVPPVRGGHAMSIVGYDDNKRSPNGHQGAFKLINSWGTGFGEGGYFWITYRNMASVCKYAYVLYDIQDNKEDPKPTNDVVKVQPPANVTATRGSYSDRIVISWSSAQGAAAYAVERAAPDSSFEQIALARSTSHTDSSIQQDVSYRYRIVTVGEESRSNAEDSPVAEGSAKSAEVISKPSQVIGLTGSVSDVSVGLSWNPTANATSYQVMRYNAADRKWVILSSTGSADYRDNSPQENAVNYYIVRASNSSGYGAFSGSIRVNVGSRKQEPSNVAPARVEGLTVSRGTYRDKILLSWNAVSGAQSYNVFRYDYASRKWDTISRSSQTSLEDSSSAAQSGRWFAYNVVAVNSAGSSPYSQSAIGKASPNAQRGMIPEPPAVVSSIDELKGTITLGWKAVKGAHEYYVFLKKEGEKDFKFVKKLGSDSLAADLPIPGKGVVFFYSVRSKTLLGGESADSNLVTGFINNKVPVVKRRFMPGDGLQRFNGVWKASHLTNTAAYELTLTVTSQGSKFKVQLQRDRERARSANGTYVAKSDFIETNGFKMQFINDSVAKVEFTNKKLYPSELDIVFTKD